MLLVTFCSPIKFNTVLQLAITVSVRPKNWNTKTRYIHRKYLRKKGNSSLRQAFTSSTQNSFFFKKCLSSFRQALLRITKKVYDYSLRVSLTDSFGCLWQLYFGKVFFKKYVASSYENVLKTCFNQWHSSLEERCNWLQKRRRNVKTQRFLVLTHTVLRQWFNDRGSIYRKILHVLGQPEDNNVQILTTLIFLVGCKFQKHKATFLQLNVVRIDLPLQFMLKLE